MINLKKVAAFGLAAVMSMSLMVGCGSGSSSQSTGGDSASEGAATESTVATKHHKIGVGLYTDSGKSVEAIKAYLSGISKTVDCEFVYTTLSTYDEATNLTEVQNLISSGCEGIILTADMGTTAIKDECEAAGVYVAGFLCDYNQSYFTAYDDVFGSEYFLGTVCDGWADISAYGEMIADQVIKNGYKNVGVVIFPEYAYPNQAACAKVFTEKIEEYNKTADEKITVKEPTVLNFAPIDATYFSENADIDCLFSIAAGASFVYPQMVAAGRTDIALYTSGFEATEDVENFGSSGNGCYKGTMCSAPEAIAYPLCLLIDKLNGTVYSDLPNPSERVDCQPIIILSDEDMAKVKDKSMYYSADYADALITGEDIVNMCASYNADATYAQLVDKLQHLGVEDL
ncbi:MAG: sugar ABC transporter substrate-binding protein [Pseudobutyrivibrio sp.]|nr:sugar ABC transporter substrate-binding protein [Pseudobutyrivibrio sp.]